MAIVVPCLMSLAGVCFPVGTTAEVKSGFFGQWAEVTGPGFTANVSYSSDQVGDPQNPTKVCNDAGCVGVEVECLQSARPSCTIRFTARRPVETVWVSAPTAQALSIAMDAISVQVGDTTLDERMPLSRLVGEARP